MKKLLILIFIGLGLCSLAQTAKPQWVNYNSKYSVNCIVPDGNTMWVGTNGGGAYQCDLQGTILLDYTTDNGFLSNNVQCIYLDSKGAKWFGTDNGLLKFENKIWTTYTKTNGLAGNLIYSIKEDSNGSIWFGTLGGISKYNGNNWISYTISNGLASNTINFLYIDSLDNKWIGTNNGLSKFDNNNWSTYTTNDGLASNNVYSMSIDGQGNNWIGTENGLSKLNINKWTTYTTANGLAGNFIGAIIVDSQGNIWIGCSTGISKYNGSNWIVYTTSNGLLDNSIWSIAIDINGNKWFGTPSGISIFNENGIDIKKSKVKISNQIYFDRDKNELFSTGDSYVKNQKVLLLPDSITTFTNYKGEYSFTVDSGKTYTVQIIPQSPYYKGTQELSYQVKATNKDTILPNVALWGKDTISFSSVFTSGIQRCGMKVPFYYTFRNNGTHPANALIAIAIDNKDSIVKTIPKADSVGSDGRLFWKYNNIPVSDDRQVQLQLLLPTGTLDTLLYKAEVLYKDSVASSASLYLSTKCSHDPNDKQVTPLGVNKEKLTLKNNDLQYTIRFQNTGNDYAYDVKILDTLSSQLNWSTFAVTASSHKLRTELSAKGLVTFFFDNIMLPDSATNYIGSNGFVSYTIKPKTSVTENTKIHNTAHIIFDQNPAVVTNTTLNTLVSSLPCSQTENQLTRFAASKLVFNGQTYTKAGTFTQNLLNANGCDSIIRLKLVLTDIVGDINGNGTIENPELAGDFNGNGKIDGNEKLGDINGDGIINNKELLGDSNGNGIIDKDELTGIIEIDGCSVSLYPIPVIDKLTIQLKDACKPSSICIVNALGQTVYLNAKPEGQSIVIDMNGMSKGSYVVQIMVEGKSYSAVVVKE